MDLRFTPQEIEFRQQLVNWLDQTLPSIGDPPLRHDWAARRAYDCAWQKMLHEAGYAGINWPTEFGGRGATPTEHLIFLEETTKRGAPYVGMNFVGLLHAGPTLIEEATDQQKQQHLPRILRGEEIWCQGFSEPGAGSDLAALQTKAFRDGDDYVVSGQKIWTSFGHVADFCELLVRTDTEVPKHRGITWLICPMDLDGITVRPIRTIAGSEEFCEVFFDEVRVPAVNRVGPENDGWRVAMVTFSFERGTAFISEQLTAMAQVSELADLARRVTRRSGSSGHSNNPSASDNSIPSRNPSVAWDDAGLRREIGMLAAQLDALWALTLRNVSQAQRTGVPGPGGSVFKLAFASAKTKLCDLGAQLMGRAGLELNESDDPTSGSFTEQRLYALSLSIAAGTSQIQRNIIGERILGLPKER